MYLGRPTDATRAARNVMRRTFPDDGGHGGFLFSDLRSTHSESVGGISHVEDISVQQQARLRSTRPADPIRISARSGLAMRGRLAALRPHRRVLRVRTRPLWFARRSRAAGVEAIIGPMTTGDARVDYLRVDSMREHVMVFLQVLANLEQSRDALTNGGAQLLG